MNRLLLDVGNSRLKWLLLSKGAAAGSGAVEHAGDPAAALARLPLPDSMSGTTALAANVTGPVHERALAEVARERHGVEIQFACVHPDCGGLKVAYADPSRLGVDRWLQMLALWSECAGAFVVASAGTALTFDAVDEEGQHLGGIIAPGLLASQQAVLDVTRFQARRPDLEFSTGLGRDTEACVRQGALHACAGLLDRLGGQYAGSRARQVLCGGDAAALIPHLHRNWEMRADLVLQGLLALTAAQA